MITYKTTKEMHTLSVAWGFAEVLPDKVTILAEAAERPQEIDVERAQKAKDRAEQRLNSNDPKIDYTRAEDALQRNTPEVPKKNSPPTPTRVSGTSPHFR